MLHKYNNCTDKECRYLVYDSWEDKNYCKLNCRIDDKDCVYFDPRHRCDDCSYAKIITYETGTIDEIDYYCKLQGDKLIYCDISFDPYDSSWPDCPIDGYKERKL